MYEKSVLANGIRVVTETMPHLRSVTLGAWVATGSRYEHAGNQGISHFIEHLVFKGTASRSAKAIAEEVDSVGGQLNAFTSKEYTCFYMKSLDTHLELAVDLLSDMLLNARFDPDDINKEQGVVLEEYNMYEDSPDELVHDLYVQEIWRNHPLGQSILGTRQSIGAFDRAKILDYRQQYYIPGNLVIAAAGNLTHAQVVRLCERYFGCMRGSTVNPVDPAALQPCYQAASSQRLKDTEQAHICLGVPGYRYEADEIYSLHLLNNLLGGSMSSRLFQSIREDRGLAYSVYSYQSSYRDTGLLTIYAGTRPENVSQVLELIRLNLQELGRDGVSAAELSKAKEQLKGNLLLGLESSSSRMSRLGTQEMTVGKYVTLDEVIAKIDRVTATDIAAVAGSLFQPELISCFVLGPEQTPVHFG
ncbi:MAG: pitrilysin family protein [Sporomusaceae bacterium]|nr:pitrilysin family protein [Sporomusaceae bacterium]